MSDPDIVVVGAGIIGVACALQLARLGRHVVVVDQQAPGRGASYGNAGHLATEQVFPIADVSILKRLPGMLLDPMGPLRLDWKYLPHALPWFLRLLWNLRPASYQRTVAGIRTLNEGSLGAWQRLLHSIGAHSCCARMARCWCLNRPTHARPSRPCNGACSNSKCPWRSGLAMPFARPRRN